MDPDVLSAENYYNEVFAASGPNGELEGRNQWLGGLLANRAPNRNSAKDGISGSKKAGGASKKSHSASPDGSNGARQRGRPRLDTQDQTAAEVHS